MKFQSSMETTIKYTSDATRMTSFGLSIFAYIVLLVSMLTLATLILAAIGVPFVLIAILRVSAIIFHAMFAEELIVKIGTPILVKVSAAVEYTKTKFIAAKAWVKTLFKKAEVAPEAAAA